MLFKGMYFKILDRKLFCYGIGTIKYNYEYKTIIFYDLVDLCVKSISASDVDLGVKTTQDCENSLTVKCSTYLSLSVFTVFTGTIIFIYFITKRNL